MPRPTMLARASMLQSTRGHRPLPARTTQARRAAPGGGLRRPCRDRAICRNTRPGVTCRPPSRYRNSNSWPPTWPARAPRCRASNCTWRWPTAAMLHPDGQRGGEGEARHVACGRRREAPPDPRRGALTWLMHLADSWRHVRVGAGVRATKTPCKTWGWHSRHGGYGWTRTTDPSIMSAVL